jgi:hypothetical protein
LSVRSGARVLARQRELAGDGKGRIYGHMVFAELKPHIEQLPHAERVKAMAFLKHLLRAENPEHQRELAGAHAEIDAGKKVRWEDLKRQLGLS